MAELSWAICWLWAERSGRGTVSMAIWGLHFGGLDFTSNSYSYKG